MRNLPPGRSLSGAGSPRPPEAPLAPVPPETLQRPHGRPCRDRHPRPGDGGDEDQRRHRPSWPGRDRRLHRHGPAGNDDDLRRHPEDRGGLRRSRRAVRTAEPPDRAHGRQAPGHVRSRDIEGARPLGHHRGRDRPGAAPLSPVGSETGGRQDRHGLQRRRLLPRRPPEHAARLEEDPEGLGNEFSP